MKILYVITSTELGGAEKALAELAAYMARENTVRVISLKPLGAVAKELAQNGVEVVSLQMRGYFPGGIVSRLAEQIHSFQPDLIHAMLYRGIEYTRCACAGKKRILVTTPHCDLSKKSIFLRWIDRLLKDLDTLTVAESFSTARYLIEKQHYQKSKVYLLPNGSDGTTFFPNEEIRTAMRLKYGFTPEETVFMSVARLSPVKDPLTLLQAFRNVVRNFPHARLVYVGEGEKRAELEAYIAENHLDKQVLLAGQQTDVNRWLNMADVFVLPSLEESLPLALLEALRVGLPCIVSKVGDMPLWVEHGKNGFVIKKQDLTLLSCVMTELVENPSRRAAMGRKSLQISRRIVHTSQQYQHLSQQLTNVGFHVKTTK